MGRPKSDIGELLPKTDITGQTFGNWRVVEISHKRKHGNRRGHLYYWNARCLNCGIIVARAKSTLLAENGCRNCERMPKGMAGLHRLLDYYRRNAKKYLRDFTLTEEEFRRLTSGLCHYCGVPPSRVSTCNKGSPNKKSDWGDYPFNGVDRMNNEDGYTMKNCVSCCGICNRAKNSMPYDEFVSYLRGLIGNAARGQAPFLQPEGART